MMHFERPYFVTPHAVTQYQKRVRPRCSAAEAIEEIQTALQQPLFEVPARDGCTLCGCEVGTRRFGAIVAPPEAGHEWPAVLTVGPWWYWHEHKLRWPPRATDPGLRDAHEDRRGRPWTPYEVLRLRDLVHTHTTAEIAGLLGRTEKAVWQKQNKLGIWASTEGRYLTSGKAARLARMTPQGLTKLARAGKLKRARRKPGGRWWLFDAEECRALGARRGMKRCN